MPSRFNVKEKVGAKLQEIFSENGKYSKLTMQGINVVERKFAYIHHLETESLLFVGLNPSNGELIQDDHRYYNLQQTGGNGYPKFWKPFEIIAQDVGITWTHLDLLGVRETKQEVIKSLFDSSLGVEFIYQHLMEVSMPCLEGAKPKIIVVANTLARLFLGKDKTADGKHNVWMGYDFIFDDELGTYVITTEGPLNGTPVFFSSMLSGQRALDNGSEERLIWQIKRIVKLMEMQ